MRVLEAIEVLFITNIFTSAHSHSQYVKQDQTSSCRSEKSLQVAAEEMLDSLGLFGGLFITDLRLVEVFEEEPAISQVPGMKILMDESLMNTFNQLRSINGTELIGSTPICEVDKYELLGSIGRSARNFLTDAWEGAKKVFFGVSKIVNGVGEAVKGVGEAMAGNGWNGLEAGWDEMKDGFNEIVSGAHQLVNSARELLNLICLVFESPKCAEDQKLLDKMDAILDILKNGIPKNLIYSDDSDHTMSPASPKDEFKI